MGIESNGARVADCDDERLAAFAGEAGILPE